MRFSLGTYNDEKARLKFRFPVDGMVSLTALLEEPNVVISTGGDRAQGVESMCILLARLAYPKRYVDLSNTFGRSRGSLCRIFLCMINIIHSKWSNIIVLHSKLLESRAQYYVDAVARKDRQFPVLALSTVPRSLLVALQLVRTVANMQKLIYTGHKRMHCLSFQSLTTPDGLSIHFSCPVEGRRRDTTVLRLSGLLAALDNLHGLHGFFIYGDPAYSVNRWMLSPFKGNNISEPMAAFNKAMSSVREAVEWKFGRLKGQATVDYKKQNCVYLSPVGTVVQVAMFLANCHCCYNGGNQISQYFSLNPPSLGEYLEV